MRRFVSCMLLIVAAACGGDSPTRPTASVVGTWNLQTVNGSALPYLVPQTDFEAVELLSDVLTAAANGTFAQMTRFRVTQDGQAYPDRHQRAARRGDRGSRPRAPSRVFAPGPGRRRPLPRGQPGCRPGRSSTSLSHSDWLFRMPSLLLAEAQTSGGGRRSAAKH